MSQDGSARSRSRAWARLGPFLGLLGAWSLFALLAGNDFVGLENQRLMLLQTAVVGTAAVGASLIIISGGIDLSVGSSIALGTVVLARLLEAGATPLVAVLGCLASALLSGAVIGALVVGAVTPVLAGLVGGGIFLLLHGPIGVGIALGGAFAAGAAVLRFGPRLLGRVELAPFIVTLGMWGALRGLAKGISDNQPVYPPEPTWIQGLLSTRGEGPFAFLPPGVWLLFAVAAVMAAVLRYTRFGRHVFAVGSSERTAALCGVPVVRTRLFVYVLGVGCAGLAGLLQFSYLSMGDPTTADGYELRVIAAVVIGGASLTGGEGSIQGTLIGALIMTIVDNGCTKLGLDNWIQDIVTGAIIVGAVALDRLRHRASPRP